MIQNGFLWRGAMVLQYFCSYSVCLDLYALPMYCTYYYNRLTSPAEVNQEQQKSEEKSNTPSARPVQVTICYRIQYIVYRFTPAFLLILMLFLTFAYIFLGIFKGHVEGPMVVRFSCTVNTTRNGHISVNILIMFGIV